LIYEIKENNKILASINNNTNEKNEIDSIPHEIILDNKKDFKL